MGLFDWLGDALMGGVRGFETGQDIQSQAQRMRLAEEEEQRRRREDASERTARAMREMVTQEELRGLGVRRGAVPDATARTWGGKGWGDPSVPRYEDVGGGFHRDITQTPDYRERATKNRADYEKKVSTARERSEILGDLGRTAGALGLTPEQQTTVESIRNPEIRASLIGNLAPDRPRPRDALSEAATGLQNEQRRQLIADRRRQEVTTQAEAALQPMLGAVLKDPEGTAQAAYDAWKVRRNRGREDLDAQEVFKALAHSRRNEFFAQPDFRKLIPGQATQEERARAMIDPQYARFLKTKRYASDSTDTLNDLP